MQILFVNNFIICFHWFLPSLLQDKFNAKGNKQKNKATPSHILPAKLVVAFKSKKWWHLNIVETNISELHINLQVSFVEFTNLYFHIEGTCSSSN